MSKTWKMVGIIGAAVIVLVVMLSFHTEKPGDDKTATTRKEIVPMALENSKDVSVVVIGEDVYYCFFVKDDGKNQSIKIPVRLAEMYAIGNDEMPYCEKTTTFKTTKIERWGKVVDEVVDDSPSSTVYRIYVSEDMVDVSVAISAFPPMPSPKVETELF